MGNRLGFSTGDPVTVQSSVDSASPPRQSAASKRSAEDAGLDHDVEDITPRKKKNKKTSDYIYETLFCHGQDSDIVIEALGKEWKLHRLYLKQSGYFASMFSGSWKESQYSKIVIDIPDLNITVEALEVAFSSLYRDEVPLDEANMCSTLAAASLLQLDGLLEQCRQYMKEQLKNDTVVGYLTAASMYCLKDVEDKCREWLHLSLLKSYSTTLLKDLSSHLLIELLRSPDLFVMQIEMDIYTMAKKWVYLALNPNWDGNSDKLLGDAENYLRDLGKGVSFLETEEGKDFVGVFKAIRLKHILNDKPSIVTIEEDRIIPNESSLNTQRKRSDLIKFIFYPAIHWVANPNGHAFSETDWLMACYRQQWLQMLSVDQGLDLGPINVTPEQFEKHSMRCGRVITDSGEYCWRWTGFSFGVDILVDYNTSKGVIKLRRNTKKYPCTGSVSLVESKPLMVRLRVVPFLEDEAVQHKLDSGIKQLHLGHDEEYELLQNIHSSAFPIYIGFNLLLTSTVSL